MSNDIEIIDLIIKPNTQEKGFRLLVEKFQAQIYNHIYNMVQNKEDAQDLTQETFIKIYKNLLKFNQKSRLYTWIYRIATNQTISYLRKKKIKTIDISTVKIERMQYSDLDKNISKFLQNAVKTLPEKQRAVFCLRYYQEMPYKKISDILETTQGALKASYHHAVKKIEVYIREHAENISL